MARFRWREESSFSGGGDDPLQHPLVAPLGLSSPELARAIIALNALLESDDYFAETDVVIGFEPFWLSALVYAAMDKSQAKKKR